MFSASFWINLYLVCCFLFNADIRCVKNYPIFLINLIDLLVTGPGFFSLVFSHQFIRNFKSLDDLDYMDQHFILTLSSKLRDLVRPYARSLIVEKISWFWYICFPELVTQRLNEYSSCICALVLAYERYILICKPLEKDVILTYKRRFLTNLAVTSLILALITGDGSLRYLNYDHSCSHGFVFVGNREFELQSRLISSILTAVLFSLAPAVVCMFYYYQAAKILVNRKKKVGRNLNLIICFSGVCFIWVLTFLAKNGFFVYNFLLTAYVPLRKFYKYPLVRNYTLRFLFSNFSGFSSVVNPYLILLGQTDYRKPFLKRKQKILKKFGHGKTET